jgi:hypothetical protein
LNKKKLDSASANPVKNQGFNFLKLGRGSKAEKEL